MSYDALALFQNLKEGSKIDVQDQEGDWFETIVRKVIGNKIICHFWGFANIWDCTIEFHPSKIAPVHTYSEISKYGDNEKVLGECVWEILSLKNMLNTNKQCTAQSYNIIQSETNISKENMQSFLDTMDAPDNIQLKLCKWVQKNVIEMGLHLRIQELMENGPDCFGYDKDIENNIDTIENMDNIKAKISESINKIENNKKQIVPPLNLANLDKISLPEIPELPSVLPCNSSTTTDNNSTDSTTIKTNGNNGNKNKMNSRKRKQSIPSKKPKKRHKKNSEGAAMITSMIDHSNSNGSKVLVTKYDANSPRKEWLDIPTKDELSPGSDGKYRCISGECKDKPAFKTYTSTCRHIQIEHQGYRYRCDLCRDEYQTEVEFRSHSTLKIHLANMHKLNKNDFSKIRIILSLSGKDSIVKKTASCDEYQFKKWKKKIINCDTIINSEDSNHSDSMTMGMDLGLNLDLNAPATKPKPLTIEPVQQQQQQQSNDKAFMNRIDELVSGISPKSNHKKDRKPICPICGQKFKNFQALGGHKKKHNPNWGRNRKKNFNLNNSNGKGINISVSDDENNNGIGIDFDGKPKRLIRSHSAEIITNVKPSKKLLKLKKNKSELDINFSTMPQIKIQSQIQMPPPPPPKLESDSEIDNEDENECQNNIKYESIYMKEEREDKLYFKYKNINENKCIKLYPFGPLSWLPTNTNQNINTNYKKNDIQWVNTKKMSVSKKYGSLILHFDEI